MTAEAEKPKKSEQKKKIAKNRKQKSWNQLEQKKNFEKL